MTRKMKRRGQKEKIEMKTERERPASVMKVNVWVCALAADRDEWFRQKHKCQAPKDGELCLRSANFKGGSWRY